jgi:hypothetical protein
MTCYSILIDQRRLANFFINRYILHTHLINPCLPEDRPEILAAKRKREGRERSCAFGPQVQDLTFQARETSQQEMKSPFSHSQAEQPPLRSQETKDHPVSSEEGFSDNAQSGVQKVEAVALVWDKSHLIASYAL